MKFSIHAIVFSIVILLYSSCRQGGKHASHSTQQTEKAKSSMVVNCDTILSVYHGTVDSLPVYEIHVKKTTKIDAYKLKEGQRMIVKGYFGRPEILLEAEKDGIMGYDIIKPFSFVRQPNPSLGFPIWNAFDAILVNTGWVAKNCIKNDSVVTASSPNYSKPVVIEGVIRDLLNSHKTSKIPAKIFLKESYNIFVLWSMIRHQQRSLQLPPSGINYLPIFIDQTEPARTETEKEKQATKARRLVGQQEAAWQNAVHEQTIYGYASYIDEYPNGKYVSQAYQFIQKNLPVEFKQFKKNMVVIPSGNFAMGCTKGQRRDFEYFRWYRQDTAVCESIQLPIQQISISEFKMSKHEVTQAQWRLVMGSNPSIRDCDNCPVVSISWNDVQNFIKKLNILTEEQYRLPSEAEWEYAARGGEDKKYAGSNNCLLVAWVDSNSEGKTHPVGQKLPNAYGLNDMIGNVTEWCYDNYKETLAGIPDDGRARIIQGSDSHVLRGGCYSSFDFNISTSMRDEGFWSTQRIGFRLAQ